MVTDDGQTVPADPGSSGESLRDSPRAPASFVCGLIVSDSGWLLAFSQSHGTEGEPTNA